MRINHIIHYISPKKLILWVYLCFVYTKIYIGVFSDLSPSSPTFGDIAFATDDVFDFGLNNPKTYLRQDSFIDEGFNDIFDVVDNKVTF